MVPTIDLREDKNKVTKQLWDAATQVGFFSVTGHGIPQSLIDDAFGASADFFAQPLEEKKKQSPGDMKNNAGFEYFAQVRPSTGVADQKESLQVTAREGVMDGRWPSQDFRTKAEALMNAAHKLAGEILDMLEPNAVPHNEPGTISKSHTLWAEDGQCTLRFLHYPPLPKESTEELIKEGYWRAGAHTGKLKEIPTSFVVFSFFSPLQNHPWLQIGPMSRSCFKEWARLVWNVVQTLVLEIPRKCIGPQSILWREVLQSTLVICWHAGPTESFTPICIE